MDSEQTSFVGALNSTNALARAAVAGVVEISNALQPVIGYEAADKIVAVMLDRLRGAGQVLPSFLEQVEKEIREAQQG